MAYENIVETVLPFATRTATPAASSYVGGAIDRLNRDQSAMMAILSVATAPSGASLIVRINGVDRLSETYNSNDPTTGAPRETALTIPTTWNILESDPITAAGLYRFEVFPAAIPVSGLVVQDFIPRFFQLTVTHGDATSSWVYALSYQMVEG